MTNHCLGAVFDPSFDMLIVSGAEMQRDDDFLRALLLEFEASSEWWHLSALHHGSPPEELKRHFHVLLLVDAGMLAPLKEGGSTYRITNFGHDFLALTRKKETWEMTKSAARHMGGASIQMLYRVAEGLARSKLADLGVPGM